MNNSLENRSQNSNPALVATVALVVSLLIACATDVIDGLLVERAQSTFQVLPAYVFRAADPFFQVVVMLALAWTLFIRLPPSRTAAVIYLVAGVVVTGTYLTTLIGFPAWQTIIGQFRNAIEAWGGTNSNLYRLAAFWIIAGITALVRRPIQTEPTPM
jgi:putative exporter of polyketide antibiotics